MYIKNFYSFISIYYVKYLSLNQVSLFQEKFKIFLTFFIIIENKLFYKLMIKVKYKYKL